MNSERARPGAATTAVGMNDLLMLVVLAVILGSLTVLTLEELDRDRAETARVLSPDGSLVAVAADTGNGVFDVEMESLLYFLPDDAWSLAFSPDGETLAATVSGAVILLDPWTGKLKGRLDGHYPTGPLAFSRDGSLLAVRFPVEEDLHIWDLGTTTLVQVIVPRLDDVDSLVFLPDGAVAAGGSSLTGSGHEITIWELPAGTERIRFGGDDPYVHNLAVSPDGTLLVSASGWPLLIRDPRTGNIARRLEATAGEALTFSSDGELIVTNHWDAADLRRVEDGKVVVSLSGHAGLISDAVFVDDDRNLITTGEDAAVCTWDVGRGRLLEKRRGFTLAPDPMPWAALVAFALWLGGWAWTSIARSRKPGGSRGRGPWVLAVLATLYTGNCVNWISIIAATGLTAGRHTLGVALLAVAFVGAIVAAWGILEGFARPSRRLLFLSLPSLALAGLIVLPNLGLFIPHGW